VTCSGERPRRHITTLFRFKTCCARISASLHSWRGRDGGVVVVRPSEVTPAQRTSLCVPGVAEVGCWILVSLDLEGVAWEDVATRWSSGARSWT
jgi:hypothetical protein